MFTACGIKLPAGDQDEVELQFHLILVTCRQHRRCFIPQAVNTVYCSWGAKLSPETCWADCNLSINYYGCWYPFKAFWQSFLYMFYISPNNPYCYDHPKNISWKIRNQNQYKFYRTLKRETILTVFSSSIIGIKNANLNELELIRDFSRFCCSEERGAEKVLVSQLPNGCKSLSYIHTLYPLNSILLLYCTFLPLSSEPPLFTLSLVPSLKKTRVVFS